jgi:hypothetical protein
MRSFSLVLLRRLLFRTSPGSSTKSPCMTPYDRLSVQTLNVIERSLLHSLLHEQIDSVHQKAVDTICDLANNSMECGRLWHALQAQAFAMCKGTDPTARDSAFRIFAGCPNLVMDLQTDVVLRVLQDGLQDRQSIDVRAFILLLLKSRCSFDFCCRSGTWLCRLRYLISRPAISTKSHSPRRSCTRCWTPSPRSPTPTSRNSSSSSHPSPRPTCKYLPCICMPYSPSSPP